jgi:hypothetical protein
MVLPERPLRRTPLPSRGPNLNALTKGTVLRKLALFAHVSVFLFLAHFAAAQQGDIAVGGATLMQPYTHNSSLAQTPLAETGGVYISISGDVVDPGRRLGLNLETSWRDHQASYYGYESYRPILTDVNVLFQPKLSKKFGLDLMGGAGFASTRFYLPGELSCTGGGYTCYTSSDHFMEHVSGGLRYYFWRNFFVRGEAHIYHIQNNFQFNSNNLVRVGASLGYTIGR